MFIHLGAEHILHTNPCIVNYFSFIHDGLVHDVNHEGLG